MHCVILIPCHLISYSSHSLIQSCHDAFFLVVCVSPVPELFLLIKHLITTYILHCVCLIQWYQMLHYIDVLQIVLSHKYPSYLSELTSIAWSIPIPSDSLIEVFAFVSTSLWFFSNFSANRKFIFNDTLLTYYSCYLVIWCRNCGWGSSNGDSWPQILRYRQ